MTSENIKNAKSPRRQAAEADLTVHVNDVQIHSRKVVIGAVAKAFQLKEALCDHLRASGHQITDLGCRNADQFVEYTTIGRKLAQTIYSGEAEFGIMCCNFGCSAASGVSKYKGVIAFACEGTGTAEMSRKVNGANVLCLGQSVVKPELACRMADIFLNARFLDIEGMPKPLREFRERARQYVLDLGTLPLT